MARLDETHDPARRSWVSGADAAHAEFPIQNLPHGVFSPEGGAPRGGIAIGDAILDVGAALAAGLYRGAARAAAEAAAASTLNGLMALDPAATGALRRQTADLLDASTSAGERARGLADRLLHAQARCRLHLPVAIGDYTDFYAGIHHARKAGELLRPDTPLPPNYKWLPIAYHGRASSVQVSGTPVVRPWGQLPGSSGGPPAFAPCRRLDLELELGFFVRGDNRPGTPVPIREAGARIFGFCLLNDWSARDVQAWEMAPLGPFLAKSFATSISPWVVTAEALAPFRIAAMARPEGDPAPLAYLRDEADQRAGGLAIELRVEARSARMRAAGLPPHPIIRSHARYLYWTPAQMVAHHTSGGCNLRPGDLLGTGTISGPGPDELGSLLELTRAGRKPFALPSGETRTFVEDGDEYVLRAGCRRAGFAPIGLGACAGVVEPARAPGGGG